MFSQHHVDQLELSQTPLQAMQGLLGVGNGRDDLQLCRQRVGAFGLTGELATQPIAVLSGGQKARIQFARVCATSPHVLVLDEPTNHLDLESIRSLAEAVRSCNTSLHHLFGSAESPGSPGYTQWLML
jgi:ATPase subunit of ABC transporter with duplicated ATPase domains